MRMSSSRTRFRKTGRVPASSEAHVLSDVGGGKRAALLGLVCSLPLPVHWSLL